MNLLKNKNVINPTRLIGAYRRMVRIAKRMKKSRGGLKLKKLR